MLIVHINLFSPTCNFFIFVIPPNNTKLLLIVIYDISLNEASIVISSGFNDKSKFKLIVLKYGLLSDASLYFSVTSKPSIGFPAKL